LSRLADSMARCSPVRIALIACCVSFACALECGVGPVDGNVSLSAPIGPAYLSDLRNGSKPFEFSVTAFNTAKFALSSTIPVFVERAHGAPAFQRWDAVDCMQLVIGAGEHAVVWVRLNKLTLEKLTTAGPASVLWKTQFGLGSGAVSTYFMVGGESGVPNAIATTWDLPPMGWNSWFAYDVGLNDTVMRSNAEGLVRTGLSALGFTYVNMDGGWQGGRNSNGTVFANTTKFPFGMGALVDFTHQLGLSFGAYTDRGQSTCDAHVGSQGYELQDAQTYAAWGIDYVKEDACDATMNHTGALLQYETFQAAINSTDRPMFFSLCGWLKWYAGTPYGIGQSWRIGPDALSWPNVLMNVDAAADAASFVGPHHYADVDEIMGPSRGRPINQNQTLTQLNLIAIIGSPLLLSFDLTNRTSDDPDVAPFLNAEVISVHQDPIPGPYYRKLAGGYVSLDKITPLTGLACNASDPFQRFYLNSTANASAGFVTSVGLPGWCLNAGPAWYATFSHAQQVWFSECGVTCDPSMHDCMNQQWLLNENGTISSLYYFASSTNPDNVPGPFMSLDPVPNAVYLREPLFADEASRQIWTFDSSTGLLSSGYDGTCIAASPRATYNVWGRRLYDGSWALAFVNFGPSAGNVTCDAACFAGAEFNATTVLKFRDLWAHADLPVPVLAGQGFSVFLDPNGVSAMYRVSVAS
jgi:alpha-galactosidase